MLYRRGELICEAKIRIERRGPRAKFLEPHVMEHTVGVDGGSSGGIPIFSKKSVRPFGIHIGRGF